MAGTFLCPNTCGFAKVIALEVTKTVEKSLEKEAGENNKAYQARVKKEQYKEYINKFPEGDKFALDFLKFHKRLPSIRNTVSKWNFRKAEEKSKFLETFSLKNWNLLSDARKREHCLKNCKGCAVRYTKVQAYFPVKSAVLKGKAKQNPVFAAETEAKKLSKSPQTPKPLLRDIKNTAKAIYDTVESVFKNTFNTSFAEALSKVPELNLQHKTKNEKRQERRDHYRHSKENIEKQMEETSFLRCYGGGQSLSAWQRSRLAMSFETKSSAEKRVEQIKTSHDYEEPANKRQKKDHTGNMDTISWDKDGLRAEVEGYADNQIINWSRLAAKYGILNKAGELARNGGQIAKEWLVSQGVDVNQYNKRKATDTPVIRKKKRKGPGGEISVPTEVTCQQLKGQLNKKLQSGEYTVGQLIVPQKYEKLVMTNEMEIKKIEFETAGRKIPMKKVRENMLLKHEQFLRNNDDSYYDEMEEQDLKERLKELNELDDNLDISELRIKLKNLERTRNLLVWLDNSTVANHGYLVCLVTCLYDPATFYTDAEYRIKTGKDVKIQRKVEQPEVHFIARCGSSDSEQLLYIETRMDCIKQLSEECELNNVKYTDKLRFCHGDAPLRAFEAGQQKGGNYFCSSCGIKCDMVYFFDHAVHCEMLSFQDRQDSVLSGTIARRHTLLHKPKPLNGLTIGELEVELTSREIYDGKKKKELQDLLTEEMHGIQRVPVLLFPYPESNLEDLGLGSYEILPVEPLHDIGHHIENFLTEFPQHLSQQERELIKESVEMCIGKKDSKRTSDYREALVKTAAVCHQSGIMTADALQAIDSLVEMQQILYSDEEKRSPALVLRYYNQSWLHSMLLKDYILKRPKKLTLRKMFGVYYHNLSSHAGLMLRIISGRASNAEEQERIFNNLKRITKHTSNYHPGQIITNLFIRLQAEKEMGLHKDDVGRQQANIAKLAQCLPRSKNTTISIDFIKQHSREWQAHLQQISDFLIEGKGVWWELHDGKVELHDITDHPTQQEAGPHLAHFRSSCLKRETTQLKECWSTCISKSIVIPIHLLRLDQPDGTTRKTHTVYLGDIPRPIEETAVEDVTYRDIPESLGQQPHLIAEVNGRTEEDEEVISIEYAREERVTLCDDEEITSATQPEPHLNTLLHEALTTKPSTTCTATPQTETSVPAAANSCDQQLNELPITKLKTHLGKALEVVLGGTEQVFQLDKLRYELKMQKKNSQARNRYLEDKYEMCLAQIQVCILAESKKLESELIKWEEDYTISNNLIAPSIDEMKSNEHASTILKKVKYSKALLKEWSIHF